MIITRHPKGTYNRGRYEPNVVTQEISVIMALQPVNQKDLQILPEGERVKAKYIGYCVDELQIIDDPDHTVYKGTEYELQGNQDWSVQGNYFRYFLMKIASQV